MERANGDGRLGCRQDPDHRQDRAVRRVDVDHVDRSLPKDLSQPAAQQRVDHVIRLGGVAVAGQGGADPDDLERHVVLGSDLTIDDRRGTKHVARHDGHVVTAPRQLRGLTVDVLGDPAEMRVVIIGDDGDPHAAGIVAGPTLWHW